MAPVRIKQYPLKLEARIVPVLIIQKFLKRKLLVEYGSTDKTYIWWLQSRTHYQLPSLVNKAGLYTVLSLKDAFFCIPLDYDSQEHFAFDQKNPETGRKTQHTWTVLPQCFEDGPTIFGNQLAKTLEIWRTENRQGTGLHYVDDTLVAAETRERCFSDNMPFEFLGN